jgi:hypothetical protein
MVVAVASYDIARFVQYNVMPDTMAVKSSVCGLERLLQCRHGCCYETARLLLRHCKGVAAVLNHWKVVAMGGHGSMGWHCCCYDMAFPLHRQVAAAAICPGVGKSDSKNGCHLWGDQIKTAKRTIKA